MQIKIKANFFNKLVIIAATLKEVEELMIPLDCAKRMLDRVVDSVPPDKGCEVLDGELTYE